MMRQRIGVAEEHKHDNDAIRNPDVMHQPGPEQEPALEAECLDSDGVHERVARLPGVATQLIGERLRTMYGLIVSEPIPDELLNLIRQLESKERTE